MSKHTPRQIVRESKFRQLIVQSKGATGSYLDISSSDSSSTGELISASVSHIAQVTASNDIAVFLVTDTNKKGNSWKSILKGHSGGPILDVSFSSLDYSLLASGGSDGCSKVWKVDSTEAIVNLESAERTVSQVRWHPTCSTLLGSSSGAVFRAWDIEKSLEAASFTCSKEISSMCWNWDGSRAVLASTTEKNVRVVDPRTKEMAMIQNLHGGPKPIICEWAGNTEHYLFTTGSSASRDREVCAWDLRKTTSSLVRSRLDNNSGALRPYFDEGTGLLFLIGHGDSNIRVYESQVELSTGSTSANLLPAIGNFSFTEPARSACLLPKPGCDIMSCEVNRIFRVLTNSIESVRVEVPRRGAGRDFQEDIFPPTKAPKETLTSKQYTRQENSSPALVDVRVLANIIPESESGEAQQSAEFGQTQPEADAASSQQQQPDAEYERLAQKSNDLDQKFSKFLGYQAKMKFSKVSQTKRDDSYFNLQPECGGSDSMNIACSTEFFAVPWKGLAGPVYIGNLSKPGKLQNPSTTALLNGHGGTVNCLIFNEFDSRILVTGSDDCNIRVWRIPENGINSESDASQCLDGSQKLEGGHRLSVRGLQFHPLAQPVLSSFAADSSVKIWDISTGSSLFDVDSSIIGNTSPCNVDWSYNGNHMAIAGKDSELKLVDPKTSTKIASFRIHDGLKGCRVSYLGNEEAVVTTGFGKTGDRQFKLWDLRMIGKDAVTAIPLDSGAGVIIPQYIEDNGVLVLYAKGELSLRIFEVEGLGLNKSSEAKSKSQNPFEVHKCTEFRCVGEPTAGLSFLPRRFCNVYQAEYLRGYRLTPSMVESISFTVPRSQDIQQYFYDDIFPETRSGVPVFADSQSWLQTASSTGPLRVDLNVEKKIKLSERPQEETMQSVKRNIASSDKMKRDLEEQEKKKKEYEENLSRMHRLAKQYEKANPNLSKTTNDDDEWDDS